MLSLDKLGWIAAFLGIVLWAAFLSSDAPLQILAYLRDRWRRWTDRRGR